MATNDVPEYAVFDDYRYSQRIAVVIRWFVVVAWLFLINVRSALDVNLFILNGMAIALVALNAYVHRRILQGRPVTRGYVLALSALDLVVITAGIGITSRFENEFFVFYYPALLAFSLVFSSRRLSFFIFTLVALAYSMISISMSPGIRVSEEDEKTLIVRLLTMLAVVAAGNLITRIERNRRRDAVEAERVQARRNLELQKRTQDAEIAALEERSRIAREIHDGIAQSIYMLGLNLETCVDLAERGQADLKERLRALVPLAKETLLETRHYIFDLKPMLSGQKGLVAMAENQIKEFSTVAGMPAELAVDGEEQTVSLTVASGLYRILQEAMANVLKHARASEVRVAIGFEPAAVRITVTDNGTGFDERDHPGGYGLANMRQRAGEMGGEFRIASAPGEGTSVQVTLPLGEGDDGSH